MSVLILSGGGSTLDIDWYVSDPTDNPYDWSEKYFAHTFNVNGTGSYYFLFWSMYVCIECFAIVDIHGNTNNTTQNLISNQYAAATSVYSTYDSTKFTVRATLSYYSGRHVIIGIRHEV